MLCLSIRAVNTCFGCFPLSDTCVASVRAMQDNETIWDKTGFIILALRNHDNGDSAGLGMSAFMQKIAPQIKDFNNWVLGEATL